MRPDARALLTGLGKFLAVVVLGTAAGAVIGIGLSKLSGNEGEQEAPPVAANSPTPSPTAAETATPTPTPPPKPPGVRVLSAVLIPATTASGRARRRARVVIRVRVANRGDVPIPPLDPVLINAPDRIRVDPRARRLAGPVLRRLRPGANAVGELRFETAGPLTARLTAQRRGRLRIGDTTVLLRLRAEAATATPTPTPTPTLTAVP